VTCTRSRSPGLIFRGMPSVACLVCFFTPATFSSSVFKRSIDKATSGLLPNWSSGWKVGPRQDFPNGVCEAYRTGHLG